MAAAPSRHTAASAEPRRYVASDNPEYWTAGQVREHFGGVSQMWLHRKLRDAGFPKPVTFGTSRRFWRISEVLEWERERSAPAQRSA